MVLLTVVPLIVFMACTVSVTTSLFCCPPTVSMHTGVLIHAISLCSLQAYTVAETQMQSSSAFDLFGSSSAFTVLADYLFGKVRKDAAPSSVRETKPVLVTTRLFES